MLKLIKKCQCKEAKSQSEQALKSLLCSQCFVHLRNQIFSDEMRRVIYRYIRYSLALKIDDYAEDLYSNTLAKVIKNIDQFKSNQLVSNSTGLLLPSGFTAWIQKIIYHLYLNDQSSKTRKIKLVVMNEHLEKKVNRQVSDTDDIESNYIKECEKEWLIQESKNLFHQQLHGQRNQGIIDLHLQGFRNKDIADRYDETSQLVANIIFQFKSYIHQKSEEKFF
jgi:DNA-directed RNA polymerase specialized sigma24 family protein